MARVVNAVDDESSKSLVNVSPADLKVICLVETASAVVAAAAVVAFVVAAMVVVFAAVELVVAVVFGATVVVSVKDKIFVKLY